MNQVSVQARMMAVIKADSYAARVLIDLNASEAAKTNAVRTAILLARPGEG